MMTIVVRTAACAAVVLLAAGCVQRGGPRQAESAQEKWPVLACRFANYGKYQEAAWTHLPSIGVTHVFLSVPPPEEVDATMARLAAHGLTAVVLRGQADLSDPAGVDVLDGQLAVCAKMGVRYMFLSPRRHGAPKEVIYERLRKVGDMARAHGVTVALETHPDLGTNAAVHLETMRGVDHPHIRINFDTGNIHYYNRNANAPEELAKIIDYVATVELKDHNGEYESWHFPALGQGVVDIPGVLRILGTHGYAGPLTMEIEGIKGVEWDEAATLKHIADSAAYVRSLGTFR